MRQPESADGSIPAQRKPGQRQPSPSAAAGQLLGAPELSWLVDRIRRRLERGEPVDGTVTLVGATPAQRKAVTRLLGHGVSASSSLSVPLPEVAERLRLAGAAGSLADAVAAVAGPVHDLAAERSADIRRWADALGRVRTSPLAAQPWYREWLDGIGRDGTVTRLIRQGNGDVIGRATAVLEHLPDVADEGSAVLPELARAATGDADALGPGPLASLVLRALARREGVSVPETRAAEQSLWAAAGVVADDLASQVLVLNLRAGGEPLGRWLTEAAAAGLPFRVTLRQLAAGPLVPFPLEVFVCASTAVVSQAATALGARAPALVCTEGQPSVACMRLLQAAVASGSLVYWHADFSWAGLRTTTRAIRRLQARPWLLSARHYDEVRRAGSGPLTGQPAPSSWDPQLAGLMRLHGRSVPEEITAPLLLRELTGHAGQAAWQAG